MCGVNTSSNSSYSSVNQSMAVHSTCHLPQLTLFLAHLPSIWHFVSIATYFEPFAQKTHQGDLSELNLHVIHFVCSLGLTLGWLNKRLIAFSDTFNVFELSDTIKLGTPLLATNLLKQRKKFLPTKLSLTPHVLLS